MGERSPTPQYLRMGQHLQVVLLQNSLATRRVWRRYVAPYAEGLPKKALYTSLPEFHFVWYGSSTRLLPHPTLLLEAEHSCCHVPQLPITTIFSPEGPPKMVRKGEGCKHL